MILQWLPEIKIHSYFRIYLIRLSTITDGENEHKKVNTHQSRPIGWYVGTCVGSQHLGHWGRKTTVSPRSACTIYSKTLLIKTNQPTNIHTYTHQSHKIGPEQDPAQEPAGSTRPVGLTAGYTLTFTHHLLPSWLRLCTTESAVFSNWPSTTSNLAPGLPNIQLWWSLAETLH